MRIALTGSSSTGKTTLANALMLDASFHRVVKRFIHVEGRALLRSMGCQSMDKMSRKQLEKFQISYFERKMQAEVLQDDFITDRSYVDIAAYWIVRDAYDKPVAWKKHLLVPCEREAQRYDVTFYLPFGILPFEKDGYRPEDAVFNRKIDQEIRNFLNEWKIRYVTLQSRTLEERVANVIQYLKMTHSDLW